MSTQPEALFLADALEGRATRAWTREEAAAKLRRLHDHTQMLEHAYKSACDIVEEQDKKLVDLEAVNQELLEALKMGYADTMDYIQRNHLSGAENNRWLVLARAAIAKAEGGQT